MRKAQQGTSYLAILFGVVIFAIAVKAVLAVWPAYWDDRVINNQITELMQQSSADITPPKVYDTDGPTTGNEQHS